MWGCPQVVDTATMPEWSKGAVLRTAVEIRVGSNPTGSNPQLYNIILLLYD